MLLKDTEVHQEDRQTRRAPTRRGFLRRITAGAAAAIGLPLAVEAGPRMGAQGYIGEITLFAGNFAPRGWAFCDGQSMQITNYQSLFSIIGTYYGGDGRKTFKLPDLRKQESRLGKVRYIIAVEGQFPARS